MLKRIAGLTVFALLLMLVCANPAYAFVSPQTIALVTVALGSFFWGFLVIISVNVALFFKKLKFRGVIRIVSVIVFLVLTAIVVGRFMRLKELNAPKVEKLTVKAVTAEVKKQPDAQPAAIAKPEDSDPDRTYDDIPVVEYEIDLNTTTEKELASYRFFHIVTSRSPGLSLVGSKRVGEIEKTLIRDLPRLLKNIEEFARGEGIGKDEKLLFVCTGGGSGGRTAVLFNNAGYDAHFARLSRVRTNNNIIKTRFYSGKEIPSSLVVAPYSWRDNRKQNVYFLFEFVDISKMIPKGSKESFRALPYEGFNARDVEGRNVVCFTNLHCLLTKYLLDYRGINDITIYKYPLRQESYRDWKPGELEELKKWKMPESEQKN